MTTGDGQSTDDRPTTGRHRSRPGTWGIVLRVAGALVLVGIVWAGWTFQRTWSESDGEPMSVVVATWMRDNNMGPLVARLEDVYYRYVDKPEEGGVPTLSADLSALDAEGTDDSDLEGADPQAAEPTAPADDSVPVLISPDESSALPTASPGSSTAPAGSGGTGASAQALRPHLLPPPTIVSPVKNPEPKEGEWQPVASRVDGQPAVYVTRVRADDVHTGYYASVMWIDTKLDLSQVRSRVPGAGRPEPVGRRLPEKYWPDVLANFNGGFRLDDSQGGYYYDGKMVRQLVDGKASTVIYKDGSIEVGKWGRDLRMSKDVEVVRQNLNLIVDKGKSKVANGADNVVWGATTDKESLAWRAAHRPADRRQHRLRRIPVPVGAEPRRRAGRRWRAASDGSRHEQLVDRRLLLPAQEGRHPVVPQAGSGDPGGLRPIPQAVQARQLPLPGASSTRDSGHERSGGERPVGLVADPRSVELVDLTVEQPLEHLPCTPRHPSVVVEHAPGLVHRVAEDEGDGPQLAHVHRHHVARSTAHQHDRVPHRRRHAPRRRQLLGIVIDDQPARPRRLERVEGAAWSAARAPRRRARAAASAPPTRRR